MGYKIAEVKFNGGNGTVLCNVCHIMLTDACDTREQIDCYHLCEECYEEMNAENYAKLYNFVRYIARDWVELSHDKVRLQRDDYMKRAKALLDALTVTKYTHIDEVLEDCDGLVEQNSEGK
jgi:hypothetical protein